MTSRERNLATVLMAIVLGGGLFLVARAVYFTPAAELDDQLMKKNLQLTARRLDIKNEDDYVNRIKELSPRLGRWDKMSLPRGDTSAKGAESHLNTMQNRYQETLKELLAKARFQKLTFTPRPPDTRSAPQLGRNQPMYTVLGFAVDGETDLKGVVDFIEGFYKIPLLHQIKSFSLESQPTSTRGTLAVKNMVVEVLLVDDKLVEHVKDRKGILPKFDDKLKAPLVLAAGRKYQDILEKNAFSPKRVEPSGPIEEPPPMRAEVREPAEDVFPFVRLSMIAYSEYYDAWVARIHNPSNKDDFNKSMLLIDRPLPEKSRFMTDKKLAEKNKGLEEKLIVPVQNYQVKNRYNENLMDMQILRIEPLRIIFLADKEVRTLSLNDDNLDTAMNEDALSKEEIKELGLKLTDDDALKKVVLKELKYRKDRDKDKKQLKGYEAHFVNGGNKDEKVILATEELPEEFEAEDTWAVKDGRGNELLKLKVVKVDKDAVYVMIDKKYYRMKPGDNLGDAREKELREAEVGK